MKALVKNSTFNVLSALGRESDFLDCTVDKYIQVTQNDGNTQLVELWNQIKQDKQGPYKFNEMPCRGRKG